MTEELDMLLAQPLAEVADSGFSNRVAAQVEMARLRRDRLRTEIGMGLVVLAVLTVPFTPLGAMLSAAAFTGLGTALIAMAVAAVLLGSAASFKRFSGSLA